MKMRFAFQFVVFAMAVCVANGHSDDEAWNDYKVLYNMPKEDFAFFLNCRFVNFFKNVSFLSMISSYNTEKIT